MIACALTLHRGLNLCINKALTLQSTKATSEDNSYGPLTGRSHQSQKPTLHSPTNDKLHPKEQSSRSRDELK